MNAIDLFSIISIAFLGSVSHCIGMCGGIVIAYSTSKLKGEGRTISKVEEFFLHLLYNLGRTITYIIFGILFGAMGSVISLSLKSAGILYVIAGVVMILAGLNLLGWFKLPQMLEVDLSSYSFYQRAFRFLLQSQKRSSFILLGMLNGLIPCGFVYFFAVKAASTASPMWGAVVMGVFGLATIPALLILGFLVARSHALQGRWRDILYRIAGTSVVGYGIFTLTIAYRFLTDPTASLLHCH